MRAETFHTHRNANCNLADQAQQLRSVCEQEGLEADGGREGLLARAAAALNSMLNKKTLSRYGNGRQTLSSTAIRERVMKQRYTQLNLKERKQIQDGLDRGDSFRAIARLIGRNVSTVSREVRENRHVRAFKARRSACRDRNWCKRIGVCEECLREGAYCAGCDARDCRDRCTSYAEQVACDVLVRAPWVCNACRKNRYGCNRQNRYVYDADLAQRTSEERRSASRQGIDMAPTRAKVALAHIKDGLSRGLSPYEISVLYEDVVGVHRSTIYRWVEAGYGGLTNLELERKVGFRPRRKNPAKRTTRHSPKRSYDEFERLACGLKESRSELDCVMGRARDTRAVMTLYNLPSHIQLAFLLDAHDCENVKHWLEALRSVMPKCMYERWTRVVLTDNGEEFSDEDGIGALLGERVEHGSLKVRLFYCDPRQSQQKGSCEKNHTEVRQILKKGMFAFDGLERADLAVLMSHVNSNPRESLGGKTPIQMLRFVYGQEDADALLGAFGIREIGRDELVLKPEILDIERAKRGKGPLSRLR